MTRRFSGAGKLAVIGLAVAAAVAMPLSASARGHDYRGGGHHGSYDRGGNYGRGDYGRGGYGHGGYDRGGYGHGGGHWSGGRWIAGAIVTGAVISLLDNALRPAPVYYDAPAYRQQRVVVYRDVPVERRRVVETRTVVYDDPYGTRYVRDDGYHEDGDD